MTKGNSNPRNIIVDVKNIIGPQRPLRQLHRGGGLLHPRLLLPYPPLKADRLHRALPPDGDSEGGVVFLPPFITQEGEETHEAHPFDNGGEGALHRDHTRGPRIPDSQEGSCRMQHPSTLSISRYLMVWSTILGFASQCAEVIHSTVPGFFNSVVCYLCQV